MTGVSAFHGASPDVPIGLTVDSKNVLTINLRACNCIAESLASEAEQALGLLESHGSRATFFVCEHAAHTHEAMIHSIAERGHEIGLLWCSTAEDGTLDAMRTSKDRLQQSTSREVAGFRDDKYSFDRADFLRWSILAEAGFRYDSSVLPYESAADSQLSLPRYPFRLMIGAHSLIEWPVATARFFGSLFPVAVDPYATSVPFWLLRRSLKTFHVAGWPAVVALSMGMPVSTRSAEERTRGPLKLLGQLLQGFQFESLDAASESLNTAELTTLRLNLGTPSKLKHRPCVTERDHG